jgi:hypothetical protein
LRDDGDIWLLSGIPDGFKKRRRVTSANENARSNDAKDRALSCVIATSLV